MDQLVQSQITGHDYIVKFNNLEQWTLIDASAGDRIAVIPYGTSTDDLQLLVLPVGTP